jgi:tryptophan-rich sensory protein
MTRLNAIGLFAWLGSVVVAAGLGGLASANAGNFYGQLNQPAWAPPGWLFGPVWSVLYLMMGVAAWLVWKTHGFRGAPWALGMFLLQLALNALWTWLFFAWHLGAWSVLEIGVLWVLILTTLISFWRLRPLASVLLIPYLAWVSFASVLAYTLWTRNPGLLG